MTEALLAGGLMTPSLALTPTAVVIEDGCVAAAGARDQVTIPATARIHDYGAAVIAPGFIDLHVHGGAGHDFMTADAAARAAIARHLARHGVTHFLATTMTAPWAATLAAVERLGAAGLGIHLEGPFLSPARCGVHPAADLLAPSPERLQALWERSQGHIRWITLAPELEGAVAFITAAAALGIGVSLGHSDATREQAQAGIAAGARHVTHIFNAMRPLHHRDPGLLGEALMNPRLSAEIIADGIHVDPLLVELFLRLKGPEQAVLVSDGISAAGCGDGTFPLGGLEVTVAAGRCSAGGHLAGSVLTLDQAVRNVMRFAGWTLGAAVRLASANPARLLGLERKGRLNPGADADLAVLSPAGKVLATYVAGQKVD